MAGNTQGLNRICKVEKEANSIALAHIFMTADSWFA
jgi:hypothetical protein